MTAQSNPLEPVKLKNGATEARAAVAVLMQTLTMLANSQPLMLYELVEKCRKPQHKIWGGLARDLEKLSLVGPAPDNRVHDTVRNIVLSAADGDGMQLALGSPLAESRP